MLLGLGSRITATLPRSASPLFALNAAASISSRRFSLPPHAHPDINEQKLAVFQRFDVRLWLLISGVRVQGLGASSKCRVSHAGGNHDRIWDDLCRFCCFLCLKTGREVPHLPG